MTGVSNPFRSNLSNCRSLQPPMSSDAVQRLIRNRLGWATDFLFAGGLVLDRVLIVIYLTFR
jgi:hypothetical protein